jgi:hypothetical protein
MNMHDTLTKDSKLQEQDQFQVPMTILVYYYLIDGQYNNLFQLLATSSN